MFKDKARQWLKERIKVNFVSSETRSVAQVHNTKGLTSKLKFY